MFICDCFRRALQSLTDKMSFYALSLLFLYRIDFLELIAYFSDRSFQDVWILYEKHTKLIAAWANKIIQSEIKVLFQHLNISNGFLSSACKREPNKTINIGSVYYLPQKRYRLFSYIQSNTINLLRVIIVITKFQKPVSLVAFMPLSLLFINMFCWQN